MRAMQPGSKSSALPRFEVSFVAVVGLTAVLAWTQGCGGAQAASHADDHHGEHHHEMASGPIRDFHDVLAPAWHETPGPTRIAKTCDSVTIMGDKAAAVGDVLLTATVSDLQKACSDPKRSDVESTLSRVHGRFHELAEK